MDTSQPIEPRKRPSQNDRLVQRGYRVTSNSAVNPVARRAAGARRRQSSGGRPIASEPISAAPPTPSPSQESLTAPVVPPVDVENQQVPTFEKAAQAEVASSASFEDFEPSDNHSSFAQKAARFIPQSALARVVVAGPLVALLVLGGASLLTGDSPGPASGFVAGASIGPPDFRYASQKPVESAVGEQSLDAHTATAAAPRTINLFSDQKARAVAVGQTYKGTIDTPDNVFDVGWFDQSASLMDSEGVIIMTAYEAGDDELGAFASVELLQPGNIISIQAGDGSKHSFKVVESNVYSRTRVDMTKVLEPVNPEVLGLNLISAGTAYENEDTVYSERRLIRAEKLEL